MSLSLFCKPGVGGLWPSWLSLLPCVYISLFRVFCVFKAGYCACVNSWVVLVKKIGPYPVIGCLRLLGCSVGLCLCQLCGLWCKRVQGQCDVDIQCLYLFCKHRVGGLWPGWLSLLPCVYISLFRVFCVFKAGYIARVCIAVVVLQRLLSVR